jgi:2',3'-cyclic-nucleotide 2'-phosphodiesterase/3'-nucleotidase
MKIVKVMNVLLVLLLAGVMSASCVREYKIEIFGTNDIHGAYFSKSYIDDKVFPSLSNLHYYVDSIRAVSGEDGVVLIDCGDNLQGSNASYYYNFEDTSGNPHLLSRIFNYMKYDAVLVGNHDLEPGHHVYDGVKEDFNGAYLAANAIDQKSGNCYFQEYTILHKGGLDVAVLGFTNPNVKSWIAPEKYEGLDFVAISDMAQRLVDEVVKKESPDVVVLAVHSGLGVDSVAGFENCAYYLASNVKGVDVVMAAHDHRKTAKKFYNGEDSVLVVEAGSKLEHFSNITVSVKKRWCQVLDKQVSGAIVSTKGIPESEEYNALFDEDYKRVRDFSNMPIGFLTSPLDMEFSMEKESPYMKFIHQLQLSQPGVDISINAPLASKGVIPQGQLIFNDLFTLYRFENLLYIVEMSGSEIESYLEAAYDKRVSGEGPLYNLDSAAGLIYTVSKSAPKGSRVNIISMADGSAFEKNKIYKVAMTSYRASGAGGLLQEAGISQESMNEKVVAVLPEIRELLYHSIMAQGEINPKLLDLDKKIGYWKFVK